MERAPTGRFTARHDLRSLLTIVAAVAGAANPDAPARTTQRAYDAARTRAGHPNAPCAAQTAVRLGRGWPEVLDLALERSTSYQATSLGKQGRLHKPWIGPEDVRVSLRIVADRLGKETISRSDYATERERMFDEARMRHHYLEPPLLTDALIRRVAGGWKEALLQAGLEPRPRGSERGLPFVDALELCLEAHGALPRQDEFLAFARANRLRLSNRATTRFKDTVGELRRRRAQEGKWTPPRRPKSAPRPDFTQPVVLPNESSLPIRSSAVERPVWTREKCIDALARLLGDLGDGTYLTGRLYIRSYQSKNGLPNYRTLHRFGKFTELVAEARERLS